MKKWLAVILVCLICFTGCSGKRSRETISFHNQTFSKADLSEETIQWLQWYNGLSEEQQLTISYIPSDLHALSGYGSGEDLPAEYQFQATVLEVAEDHLLLEPAPGSRERGCSDKIVVAITGRPAWPMPQEGDNVNVVYDGIIQELYPARIPNLYRIEIIM